MSLAPGARVGQHEIVSQLGAGGMGEVYRARDSRLGREVAIKVLPQRLAADPQALARFRREARIVAALSHPNIVAIHDFGSENGVFYAVTELLEGETLRNRIDVAPLAWRKAAEIGLAVAEGLVAAHSRGIIHRDLKPENIFLTFDGRVKILDFGLALSVAAAPDDVTQTSPGSVVGTVAYMSPEQVRGITADARSDLFSFGSTMFEMVTGRRAFDRPTAAETMTAILREQAPDLTSSGQHLPVEFSRLITHCLEKKPEQRFQSASDVVFALKAMLSGALAIEARPVAPARMRPAMWLAAGLYRLTGRRRPIDSLAVLPFVNVSGDSSMDYLGDGIAESLINSLSQLPKLRVAPRGKAFRFRGWEADSEKVGRELNVRAVLTGRVVQRGDGLNVQADLVDVATDSQLWGRHYSSKLEDILRVQEDIAREISERLGLRPTIEERARLARRHTEDTEAYQLYLKGRYYWNRRTAEMLKKAVAYFEQAIQKDPGYALAHSGLADCYAVFSSYMAAPASVAFPKAIVAARRALELDPSLADAHAALGWSKTQYEWDWAGAEAEFKRAIELKPDYATAHQWYGNMLECVGRLDEALQSMKRALDLEPLSLIINSLVGRTMYFERRYRESVEQLRKTLELDPNFVPAHSYLAKSYERMGLFREAAEEFHAGLSITPGDPQLLGSLGHLYAVSGDRAAALEKLAQVQELSKTRYVWLFDTALIYLGLGDIDAAFEWFDRACDDRSAPMAWIKVEPRLDSIRDDPRFSAILRKMRLIAAKPAGA